MGDRVIDLEEEFLDLMKREEIFAFFDFSLSLPADSTVSGLCKISRPKPADSGSHYFSMVFMLDAADDRACRAINEYFKAIDWEELGRAVPGILSFAPMPCLSQRAGVYITEVDVYLTAGGLTKNFLERFHSALAEGMRIRAENPIYWDDLPQELKPVMESKTTSTTPLRSFLDRIRKISR